MRIRNNLFTALLLLATALPLPCYADLVFATSEYEPYVTSTQGNTSGIIPDIVRAAFSGSNQKLTFEFMPWKRASHEVEKGKAFATFPYIITPEREAKFNFSDPIIFFFPKFFYLKSRFPNGFQWKTPADFKPYILGGVLGYWYKDDFEKLDLQVVYANNDSQNINLLRRKRIDFTLIDEIVGWRLIEKSHPGESDKFDVLPKPESSEAFRLMISKKYPNSEKLKATFNQGLQRIKKSGEYQKILNKYNAPTEYSTINF